jgi:hypothetical protein
MSPEVMQLIYLAAAAAIGWFLRHRLGPLPGASPGSSQQPNPWPAVLATPPGSQHPLVDSLTKFLLEKLNEAIQNAPVTPPK